jgi:hypothetical protein
LLAKALVSVFNLAGPQAAYAERWAAGISPKLASDIAQISISINYLVIDYEGTIN